MKVTQPKFPVGTKVRTHLRIIRGYRLKRGEIGEVIDTPMRITGDYAGHSYVDFPSVPGTHPVGESLLYTPRKRKSHRKTRQRP